MLGHRQLSDVLTSYRFRNGLSNFPYRLPLKVRMIREADFTEYAMLLKGRTYVFSLSSFGSVQPPGCHRQAPE